MYWQWPSVFFEDSEPEGNAGELGWPQLIVVGSPDPWDRRVALSHLGPETPHARCWYACEGCQFRGLRGQVWPEID